MPFGTWCKIGFLGGQQNMSFRHMVQNRYVGLKIVIQSLVERMRELLLRSKRIKISCRKFLMKRENFCPKAILAHGAK
jgi:hypothetical protein